MATESTRLFRDNGAQSRAASSYNRLAGFLFERRGRTGARMRAPGSDGNFYGTTSEGGTTQGGQVGCGTLFKISPEGAYTSLHSLDFASEGCGPFAGLIPDGEGGFLGTTRDAGPAGGGSVFSFNQYGQLSLLHAFVQPNDPDGSSPYGKLMQGTDGNYYGTTWDGGVQVAVPTPFGVGFDPGGVVFRLTPEGIFTKLYSFGAPNGFVTDQSVFDGLSPIAGLVEGSSGNLFGTTYYGGYSPGSTFDVGRGTVYAISLGEGHQVLHVFSGLDGALPWAELVLGSDGKLYGTTQEGGANGQGTVFSITQNGNFTLLHSFGAGEGRKPFGALVEAPDGSFYGTTYFGAGREGVTGTIFRVDPSGNFSTVHVFENCNGHAQPLGGLVRDPSGAFYGTTGNLFCRSGSSNCGIIYRYIPSTAPRASMLQLSSSTFTVDEGGNFSSLTVTRGSSSQGEVSIYYRVEDNDPDKPSGYAGNGGTLCWADGDTATKSILLGDIPNDSMDGGTKSFRIVLDQPSTDASLGARASATVNILDNDAVGTPAPFTFLDQTDVPRNAVRTSNAVTITGISTAVPISASGGIYSIGCTGSFTSVDGTISDGQTVCVRHTSSTNFGTAVNTLLTVGGVSDIFTSTTPAADTTPNAFTFTDQSSVARSSVRTSNAVTINGINTPAMISVAGGTYSIGCDGTFRSTSSTISAGQTVCVRHTSSSNFNSAVNTTLTIGGVSDTFTSTTLPADVTPNQFSFADRFKVLPLLVMTSNTVTISGINTTVPIAVSNGPRSDASYSINGGAFVKAPGTIKNGDKVRLRNRIPLLAKRVDATITIGGVSDTWTLSTQKQ